MADDGSADQADAPADVKPAPELSPFQEADRFVLAIRDGFVYEPQHDWLAVAGALAARVLELQDKPEVDVAEFRRRERWRLAELFQTEADALRTMVPEGLTPELVAFMLKLDHG